MLTLAIDTATSVCAVGLCRDGRILAEYRIDMGMTHSEGLLPQLEQLLSRTKVAKSEIDLLAVSLGPGSFTGLRIGLASVEAMAYSWKKPVCGVNTLKALAYNLPVEGFVLSPVLDAQKGNFYQAIYEWRAGKLIQHQDVKVVDGQQLLENLAVLGTPALLLGECRKLDDAALPGWCKKAPAHLCLPQAGIFLAWSRTISEGQRPRNYGKNDSRDKHQSFDGCRSGRCWQNRRTVIFRCLEPKYVAGRAE